MEGERQSKKRVELGVIHQTINSETTQEEVVINTKDNGKHQANKYKRISNNNITCFYTNADQFVNKKEELVSAIADEKPDIILITEVIPKNQTHPI